MTISIHFLHNLLQIPDTLFYVLHILYHHEYLQLQQKYFDHFVLEQIIILWPFVPKYYL